MIANMRADASLMASISAVRVRIFLSQVMIVIPALAMIGIQIGSLVSVSLTGHGIW